MHMEKYRQTYEEIVIKFLQDLYMDDSVTGAQTKSDTYKSYEISKNLMLEGGFILRKWICNDNELQQRIRFSERETSKEPDILIKPEFKVLGVKWKPIEDKCIFSLQDVVETALNYQGSITKRHMVKITASHYDPPGILSPILIRFKFLVQEACQQKLSWDTEINEGLDEKMEQIVTRFC